MQRIGVLNGNNITYDHDLAGLVRGLTDWGVIQWGEISENKVQPVQAVIACQRSNGQKLMLYFESDEQVSIPSSGIFKVYIEVDQAKIDDGSENAENWSGIASIKTWPTLPSQNFLLLATVADWVVKDERNLIPKIQSVAQRTWTLEEKLSTAEGKITQLVEAGTPSYLWITGIVGEKYTMEDTLFLQKTPTLANSVIAINIWDIATNKEQHIQRIASWTASNQLKLKMKKFWAPTTTLCVEVRKGVKVDVSEKEAYRYWGEEVVASATIPYSDFNSDWKEHTITLNNQFWATKGELLDIVVYQQGGIVNATNYYQIACDSTQYSEAFSAVAVNGNSRVRNLVMPFCISEWFLNQLLCKASDKPGQISCELKQQLIDSLNFDLWDRKKTLKKIVDNNFVNWVYALSGEFIPGINGSWSSTFWACFDSGEEKTASYPNDKNSTIWIANIIKSGDSNVVSVTYKSEHDYSNYTGNIRNVYLQLTHILKKTVVYEKVRPRSIKSIWTKTLCTIFGRHIDSSWIWAKKINTWKPLTVATWQKSWNSIETISFLNEGISMFFIDLWVLSWDKYSTENPALWSIEVLVSDESYLSISVNWSKTSNSALIILPIGEVKFKLTTHNYEGRRVDMPYSIRRQS